MSGSVDGIGIEPAQFHDNPLHTLAQWAQLAEDTGQLSPRTMTFATADADGHPHARTVLTTVIDDESVRFHSSRPTIKTTDLAVNPRVSGVFYWPGLARQVTMHGIAHELPADVSRQAYPTRPPQLQLLAWVYEELGGDAASSAVNPDEVDMVFAAHAQRDSLPMPPSWTTIRLVPDHMLFWVSHGPEHPPVRVRYVPGDDAGWHHHNVLP
jgi:pyridoxamine 5'-phosphate oxidase